MPSENDLLLPQSRHFQKANYPNRFGRRRGQDPTVESVDISRLPLLAVRLFPGTHHSCSALAVILAPDEWPFHIQKPLGPCDQVGPKGRRRRNDIRRSSARCVTLAPNDFVPGRALPSSSTAIQG